MKTSKITLKIILSIFLGAIGFISTAIVFFWHGTKKYEREQNEYFSKVEYLIEGQIVASKLLGGGTYFIEIDIDTIAIPKNNLSKSDDFVGLYDPEKNKVYVIASDNLGQCSYELISSDTLPYIKISSERREILYIRQDTSFIDLLMTHNIYRDEFLKMQTIDMVRF